eukprot:TRINITY_DN67360_c7_g1_i1.p1 TRINITY_DN67360_c7_g1~~TRINITY_DN67360_c7_g1_i1.p1  ORF type:complete len:117 (+),score=7.09 TRINITY_DN67360_c7_g1_i1:27-353(+)
MANNLFSNLPTDLSEEVFEELAKGTTTKIERIVSKGHTSPPEGQWYDQDDNEWVIVLEGSAILEYDREQDPKVALKKGDYINIPAHEKHRVAWTDPEKETVWLAVHYK